MAYLAKAQKDYLKTLATELGLEIGEMMRAERDEKEENDYKRKQEGLILELERMKLSMTATSTNTSAAAAEKINIQHLIPKFVENFDISTYFKIFERQCEQVNKGCDESVRNLSTNLLRRLSGEYKFAFISNQLQKDERDI
ncbi:hypothetical protein TNCV_3497671 [Trichonephila clavipes]|nr:hypothetical protein TNCV_3497671 [Trichonephila clavipes]